MKNKEIGNLGEYIAEKFLVYRDYMILHKNYHCRFGEIDLIAKKNSQLVFVEVKARTSNLFGEPQEAIIHSKKQKLIKSALHFLNSTTQTSPFSWRIDVIALKLDKQYRLRKITHFKNILNG